MDDELLDDLDDSITALIVSDTDMQEIASRILFADGELRSAIEAQLAIAKVLEA